ncbi:MAG: MFS transporter [Anaerolineae bacterium]|nr:MFS transporter [Anaerolineae bacterium]
MPVKSARFGTRLRSFLRYQVLFPAIDVINNTARLVFRGPRLRDQTERNIWYLYLEIMWAGFLSAAAAFNATFAVRLGASNTMIGWLSSIPALLAVILLIPAARFLETKAKRTPWVWSSLLIARLGYGLIIILPWLIPTQYRAQSLVWLLIAISVPTTFFSAGFTPLLADVIPERDRARVLANRNIVVSAIVAVLTFLAGRWLEAGNQIRWATFPLNYQILYLIGFIGAMISMAYLFKLQVPPSKIVERKMGPSQPRMSPSLIKTLLTENRDFAIIIINTLVFNLGAWLVMPLYIIFFVNELGASDGWIGVNSTLANIGVIIGYTFWQRRVRKWGYQRTLLVTVPLAASYAFLVSLFPNLTAILAWGVLISVINPGVDLSHFNLLLKLCPEDRRASYIAFFAAVMNAGAFVGPMIGVALSEVWSIRTLLLIGGGIRLFGALLFHIFPFKTRDSTPSESG